MPTLLYEYYTVVSRLKNGKVAVDTVHAHSHVSAERDRRQWCSTPDLHVANSLNVQKGKAVPHVVCYLPVGSVSDTEAETMDVMAANIDQALFVCEQNLDVARTFWADAATPPHAHVSRSSSDCDGRYEYHTTIDLPIGHGEEASTLRQRLGTWVAEREVAGLLRHGIEFTLTYYGGGIVIDQPTDEGGSSTAFLPCDDKLCDERGKDSQRDYSAEAMGY